MQVREFLYEGKAKQIYATDDEKVVLIKYKDDATAFDGQKKGTILNKGIVQQPGFQSAVQTIGEARD